MQCSVRMQSDNIPLLPLLDIAGKVQLSLFKVFGDTDPKAHSTALHVSCHSSRLFFSCVKNVINSAVGYLRIQKPPFHLNESCNTATDESAHLASTFPP